MEATSQLSDVKPFTRMVTLTIGGNDLGFAPKFRTCVFGTCPDPLVGESELLATKLRLTQLYLDIRGSMRADGRLFVLTYPIILPNPNDYPIDVEPNFFDCFGTNSQITSNELRRIRDATRRFSDTIKEAVDATGDPNVVFVDVTPTFIGHRVCSDRPYATGIKVTDPMDSFHPNPDGHQAMANQLSLAIRTSSRF